MNLKKIPCWAKLAGKCGIEFEAVHAPSDGVNSIWEENCKAYVLRLEKIINYCSEAKVGKIVLHVAIGEDRLDLKAGLERFSEIEDYAENKKVHLCYENSTAPKTLIAVVKNSSDYHGFCYDCGHNQCYTPETELLNIIGDKLMYTHLHDNFGQKKDLHLLPYDGIRDWEQLVKKLKNLNYSGTYNLEFSCNGDKKYNEMTYMEFTKQAYETVKKLRAG